MLKFFSKIKDFFSNLYATVFLGLGLAITALGIGVALYVQITAILSIAISSVGSFLGALVIAAAMRRFTASALVDSKLVKAEEKNKKLSDENEELHKENKDLKAENQELHHRLEMSANITKIQPILELTTGEITFDITDCRNDRLDDAKPEKHWLSGHWHLEPEFYRGVYKYAGKLYLAANLAKIKVLETENEITILGPFEYRPTLGVDNESKWLIHGRREREYRTGDTEDSVKDSESVEKITVTVLRDAEGEDKHRNWVMSNIKNLSIIDSMKVFTDKIVIEFVKLMLAPTNKKITYIADPGALDLPTVELVTFITKFNEKIETCRRAIDNQTAR